MSTKLNARETWEAEQIKKAECFMATVFLGRGKYARQQAPTLEEAEAAGRALIQEHGGRGAMIYAVTPEVSNLHVKNI